VLEANLFTNIDTLVDWEGKRGGFGENLKLGGQDFDGAGRNVGVLIARWSQPDFTDDLHTELGSQLVRALGHLAFTENDLSHSTGITEIDEDHPAMITPTSHPSGERDGLAGVFGTQGPGVMGAKHCDCSLVLYGEVLLIRV